MTETHLVLCPAWEYDGVTLLFPGNKTWSATGRAWSRILAQWANEACWCEFDEWEYIDFYMGSPFNCIEHYEEWVSSALSVIQAKSTSA